MGERVIRDFGTILQLIARGRFHERVDDSTGELLDALEAAGDDKASGSITVTLEFQRLGERTDIKGTVKVKPPAAKPLPAYPLFNVEGGLSVQHPGQTDLFGGPREARARDTA